MGGIWLGSYIALWLLLIVQGVIVLAVARQVGILLLRLGPRGALNVSVAGGPEVGTSAPVVPADVDRRLMPLILDQEVKDSGFAGTVLVFASPGCGSCSMIPEAVSSLARAYEEVRYAVIASGEADVIAKYRIRFPAGVHLIQDNGSTTRAYSVNDLPYAVFVDAQGVVRHKGVVNNREHLEDLVIKGLAVCRHRHKQEKQAPQSVSV